MELSTQVKQALQGAGLVLRRKDVDRIAGAGREGQFPACCCTSMEISIAGFPTYDLLVILDDATVRSTTRNCYRKSPPAH